MILNLKRASLEQASFAELEAQPHYYRNTIEAGLHTLFEKRATTCPMCGSPNLVREQILQDLVQFKPGYFHMSRCESCGHIFQNPRLNKQGLDFYYRDFYSGAGEAVVQGHLATMKSAYRARAKMIKDLATPRCWLDIGAAYGQFCHTAKGIFPDTEFEVLDISPAIQRAQDLGWAKCAYTGSFLDLAPVLDHTYDMVSMFHYLEHTTDPLAELIAAAEIVQPGGFLMIEVPDPDSLGRHLLGRYWPSWFAPQHLHLIPSRNLDRYLRDLKLKPVRWHRARAHQSTDALFAAGNFLQKWSPPRGLAWDTLHAAVPLKRQIFLKLSWPALRLSLKAVDWMLSPLRYVPRWPNTYRVLARKLE